MMAAGFELEFDGEELWHVETNDYTAKQRLNAGDWTLDRNLPSVAHYSIGSCFYNIPRCITGEKNPTESMEVEVPEDSQEVEMVVLVIGILVGFLGFVLGIVIVVMSKLELRAE